ncbi:hypothetical protein GCM10011533_33070 [Streptosporangium jomthongense]|nr:hypothetical protein GCM10011533_33070 [Streptosporangium jomthongense]
MLGGKETAQIDQHKVNLYIFGGLYSSAKGYQDCTIAGERMLAAYPLGMIANIHPGDFLRTLYIDD